MPNVANKNIYTVKSSVKSLSNRETRCEVKINPFLIWWRASGTNVNPIEIQMGIYEGCEFSVFASRSF